MDWANGNEACPPSIGTAISGMYRDQNPIHSCHEFSRVMGSMNASHFYPLAKSFYEHYHALAKARMSECPGAEPAAQIDEYFWPDDDILHSFGADMGISPKHTPGHVCEREAMAYEMIAQHFLQDGWSTGHMWHRWGYPEIEKFNFALPDENLAHIPATNQKPRRATIAMLTAIAAGQIHGARSVIDRQIRDYFDRETAERILATGLTDDPLSAPRLTDFQLTSWIPGASPETGVPAVFPGAGDLYWDPFVPTDPDDPDAEKLQVRWAPTYDRQRTQMIACAATSMLEVYKAGSQIHGELAEGPIFYNPLHGGDPVLLLGGGDEAAIDTLGDYCWGQLATNLSMEHATGVVSKLAVAKGTGFEASLLLTDAATAIVQAFGQNFSALVANVVVLDQEVKGALDFPTGPAPIEPYEDDVPCTALDPPADRICDRERFITGSTFGVPVGARVGLRLQQDSLNTMTQFFLNRIHTAHGSSSGVARKSARLLDGDGNSITMLGVPPSHEAMISEGGQKKDPIVPYVDRPVQSYDAFTPVQHMFWRGRIKEICEHTATNWSAVEQLQAACQAGSGNGGNVAACTSCVEIASLHAPLRGLTPEVHPAIDQTACSLVGTYALDYSEGLQRIVGAPAGMPSEWFDLEDGDAAPGEVTYAYDWTPGKVAFHWCTGVPNELLDEEAAVGSIIPAETDARVFEACPQVGPSTISYTPEGTYDLLRAWTEGGRSTNSLVAGLPTPGQHHISDLQQFLPEVVSIRERQTDTLTDCDTYPSHRSRTSSDFDARVQEVLGGLPYVDNAQYGTRVLQSSKTGLYAPVCGESMGYSAWTVSCDEVRWLFDAAGYFDSFAPEITEAPPGESWNPSYAQFVSTSDGKCVVHEPARFRQCPQGSECGADGRCRLSTVTCNDLSCQKPEVQIIE